MDIPIRCELEVREYVRVEDTPFVGRFEFLEISWTPHRIEGTGVVREYNEEDVIDALYEDVPEPDVGPG